MNYSPFHPHLKGERVDVKAEMRVPSMKKWLKFQIKSVVTFVNVTQYKGMNSKAGFIRDMN
jgi:hypothetical protein